MSSGLHNAYTTTPLQLTEREAHPELRLDLRDCARFWAKVEKGTDEACWPWTSSRIPRGYGQFLIGGRRATKVLYAHRIAWTLSHGPIPAGLFVCHHCDQPWCCNPKHLFVGTHQDNMDDAKRKGRPLGAIARRLKRAMRKAA